ncbi:Uncharacterised protein [Vibrio cholerae]|nr:Uncharacterised protein [Vibrio cholerae]
MVCQAYCRFSLSQLSFGDLVGFFEFNRIMGDGFDIAHHLLKQF